MASEREAQGVTVGETLLRPSRDVTVVAAAGVGPVASGAGSGWVES